MKPHLIFALLMTVGLSAQNTLQLKKNQESPKASLSQVSWLAGHWKGEAFGGTTEELWSPPMGGSMMFVFKLANNDTVTFYETGHIQQVDNTLILQLKHFDGNLKGWESQDETIDFKLVKIEEDRAYFEGFTLEKTTANEIKMYVLIRDEMKKEEVTFVYGRVGTMGTSMN